MRGDVQTRELKQRLSEADAVIKALLSGQIDAMVDSSSDTPLLLSRAQQALRASEVEYRQIVEATSDGIMKLDLLERIVFVNRRLAEMLGYSPAEMVGASLSTFMSPTATRTITGASRSGSASARDAVDTAFRHKDGTNISVNIATSSLLDPEGRHVGTLEMVRDVTDRQKLQAQLMVSDRMASMGTLAAGVAHEINNPLTAVIGNLAFVADSLEQAAAGPEGGTSAEGRAAMLLRELKEPLEDAREGAERVRLIVRDLKMFSRSPSEEPTAPVDVEAVMDSTLRMAWNEVRHRATVVKAYGVVPRVAANEARMGQVFLNLILNATQAMPEGRAESNEIRVSTRLEGRRVIVEVRDTGPGIPPDIINRIFDAFFTTKAVGVGTGLGLAISQRIVTDMGGLLTVASELGKGTTFRVALPVSDRRARDAPAPVECPAAGGRRGHILVVDDEELILRGVQRSLEEEHEVVAVLSAKEALALCAGGETFDLILCDLMMPDMTGVDLHHELSRVAPEQASRMIFMTGGAFTETARQFLAGAAQHHIQKPFDLVNLRAAVRRQLQQERPAPS
jgi:PAS domain S-box-containing protein